MHYSSEVLKQELPLTLNLIHHARLPTIGSISFNTQHSWYCTESKHKKFYYFQRYLIQLIEINHYQHNKFELYDQEHLLQARYFCTTCAYPSELQENNKAKLESIPAYYMNNLLLVDTQ